MVRIGNSAPAPLFKFVALPNDCALSAPLAIGASDDFRPVWTSSGRTEFVTEGEPHMTYAEVSRS